MIVEISMLAVGVWLCARTARDRIGQYSFVAYVVLLLIPYVGDRFSTDPPTVSDILWTGIIAEVLLPAGAWWFDYHRDLRSESLSGTYLRR